VTIRPSHDQEPAELSAADEQALRELTERARASGMQLTGGGGLLGKLTKVVAEGAQECELDDHLGYGKHDPRPATSVIPATATGQDGAHWGRAGGITVPRNRTRVVSR
jgi:transposase-like protein